MKNFWVGWAATCIRGRFRVMEPTGGGVPATASKQRLYQEELNRE